MPEPTAADHSLRVFRPLAHYVADNFGPEALSAVAAAGGVPVEDLRRGGRWVSHAAFEALAAETRRLVGSEERFLQAAAWKLTEGYGPLLALVRATSPERVFQRVARESSAVTRVSSFAVRQIDARRVALVHTSTVPESRLLCLIRQAQAAALPTAWGLPPAAVKETACVCRGDDACVYEVSWLELPRLAPKVGGAAVGAAVACAIAVSGLPAAVAWLVFPFLGWVLGASYEQRRVHRSHLAEIVSYERAVREISAEEGLARGHRARAEANYQRIVENASDGVWAVDAGGSTTFANRRMEEILGVASGALVGTRMAASAAPEHRAAFEALLARQGAEVAELRFLRRDGVAVWVHARISPFEGPDGAGALGFFTDVTDARAARDALAAGELRFSAILARIEDLIVLRDASGQMTWSSPSAQALLGYDEEEMRAHPVGQLAHPDDGPAVLARLRALGPGETSRGLTVRLRHADGTWRWFEGSITTNLLHEPAVGATVSNFRDVTAKRALEEQLRHTQRMESIGQLAGGVAHDFNNLLSVILGYCGLLLPSLDPADPVHADVTEIEGAARRAAGLTHQLLAFSRRQVLAPVTVDLDHVVSRLASLLRRLIGEHIDLRIVSAGGIDPVKVDPGQFEQVLMNLALNARDAMPNGGILTVETRNVEIDASDASDHAELVPGPHVLLAVSDTGVGMDTATRARAFEPFFTTKDVGRGTGLGLATVFGIVRQSGGSIWLYSEPGVGTTVKIHFPVERAVDAAPPPQAADPVGATGAETVLVVEDEPRLRALTCRILRRAGYDVLEADHPAQALEVARSAAAIHLLLTDVVMPGMNGRELADAMAPGRPEMKVLFMSGYTDDSIVHHGILHEGIQFLQKPFTPKLLTGKVRDVLGPPQA